MIALLSVIFILVFACGILVGALLMYHELIKVIDSRGRDRETLAKLYSNNEKMDSDLEKWKAELDKLEMSND